MTPPPPPLLMPLPLEDCSATGRLLLSIDIVLRFVMAPAFAMSGWGGGVRRCLVGNIGRELNILNTNCTVNILPSWPKGYIKAGGCGERGRVSLTGRVKETITLKRVTYHHYPPPPPPLDYNCSVFGRNGHETGLDRLGSLDHGLHSAAVRHRNLQSAVDIQ